MTSKCSEYVESDFHRIPTVSGALMLCTRNRPETARRYGERQIDPIPAEFHPRDPTPERAHERGRESDAVEEVGVGWLGSSADLMQWCLALPKRARRLISVVRASAALWPTISMPTTISLSTDHSISNSIKIKFATQVPDRKMTRDSRKAGSVLRIWRPSFLHRSLRCKRRATWPGIWHGLQVCGVGA